MKQRLMKENPDIIKKPPKKAKREKKI